MPQTDAKPIAHFWGDTPEGNHFEADLLYAGGNRYGSGMNWEHAPTSGDMIAFKAAERSVIAQLRGAPVAEKRSVAMTGATMAHLNTFLSTGLVPMELN